jgi:hypothetical protein
MELLAFSTKGKQKVGQGYTLNDCLELHTKKVPDTTFNITEACVKEDCPDVAFGVVIVFGCKCCRYNKELQVFISKI